MIGHLVIVAGVSGSGKSTLVAQMQQGIGPLDLRGWPDVTIRSLPRWNPNRDYAGLIFDYDIDGKSEKTLPFVDNASRVTVINVRPPLERIVSQLVSREATAAALDDALRSRVHWRVVKVILEVTKWFSPLTEKKMRRHTPFRVAHRVQRMERKLAIYSEDYLENLYGRWDAQIARIADVTVLAV